MQGRFEFLPVASESADVVVATFVLCSVPSVATALAEAWRVLRPGGRYLFAEQVPRAGWHGLLDRRPPWRLRTSAHTYADDPRAAIGRTFGHHQLIEDHGRLGVMAGWAEK